MTKPDQALWVSADKLPFAKPHYVVWLDVMGVQSIMSQSLSVSSNFILKFHSAALDARQPGIEVFPVMDGLYIVAADQDPVKSYLHAVLERLAYTFTNEKEEKYKFVVRGGIAYGPLIRGSDVSHEVSNQVRSH